MSVKSINVSLTESEVEVCWTAASYVEKHGVATKLGAVLDHAALNRLYNTGDAEVTGYSYGSPQLTLELTRDELYALIDGLERAVGRHELGLARPVPTQETQLPVQRYHDVHRKLYRIVAPA